MTQPLSASDPMTAFAFPVQGVSTSDTSLVHTTYSDKWVSMSRKQTTEPTPLSESYCAALVIPYGGC